jgi:DNA-binding IclR family transcriptional regulator
VLSTVHKIGAVLDLFTVKRPEWGVSEASVALDIPKSSAHAMLVTMAELGLLERTSRARYRLGWRLVVLGRTVMLNAEYRRPIELVMQRAVSRCGETLHFAVHERGAAVYVHKVEGPRSIPLGTGVGMRLPAHASAVGKVLLAHRRDVPGGPLGRFTANTIVDAIDLTRELEAIRKRGVAFDDEESLRGVACVACPVWGHDGAMIGAISLATTPQRLADRTSAYVKRVVETCDEASRQLGAITTRCDDSATRSSTSTQHTPRSAPAQPIRPHDPCLAPLAGSASADRTATVLATVISSG